MKNVFYLEPPYSDKWTKGYLVRNGESRNTVILYNSPDDRSSVSYARYLMAVSLGRYLAEDEHVDHKDDDKTNDVLENLQILTPEENRKKSIKGHTFHDRICPWCKNLFKLEQRQCHKKRKFPPCCSRSCSAKLQHSA